MSCINCSRGLCFECELDPCCCTPEVNPQQLANAPFSQGEPLPEPTVIYGGTARRGRPPKDDSEISTSAGRKRAAVLYPIDSSKPCDWRGLANCGGGKFPIIGCVAFGVQRHRHHGPVKHTARNEQGNVHLICEGCHNTWHAKNDPVYDQAEYELLPHNPRPATPDEMLKRGAS